MKNKNTMMIYNVLHLCGLSGKYRGYPLLIAAVQISIQDDGLTRAVTRSLYTRVAQECHCPLYCVERNIRTMVMHTWNTNRDYLQEIAGYPLHAPPTSSEFIGIIASHILRNRPDEKAEESLSGRGTYYH